MKEKPKTVGFQLENEQLKQLVKEGKQFNMSAGQYARQLVLDALEDASTERLEKRMIMLETEITATRRDNRAAIKELQASIAVAMEAVLINMAKMPSEKVKEWADRNLRPR